MNRTLPLHPAASAVSATLLAFCFWSETCVAQDRLKTMPGYERYVKMNREMTNAVKLGSLSVTWKENGNVFEYQKDGKRYRYDIATRTTTAVATSAAGSTRESGPAGQRGRRRQGGAPARGRQFTSAISPDGKLRAF